MCIRRLAASRFGPGTAGSNSTLWISWDFSFVRYGTLEEATKAVSEFNGKVLGNRGITVELASETRRKLAGLSEDEDGPLAGEH